MADLVYSSSLLYLSVPSQPSLSPKTNQVAVKARVPRGIGFLGIKLASLPDLCKALFCDCHCSSDTCSVAGPVTQQGLGGAYSQLQMSPGQ